MANVQTDQGWYADENWVRQSAGVLGKVGGFPPTPGPSQFAEVPNLTTLTAESVIAAGYCIGTYNNNVSFYIAVSGATSPVIAAMYDYSYQGPFVRIASSNTFTAVGVAGSDGYWFENSNKSGPSPNYYSGAYLRFYYLSNWTYNIPGYTTEEDAKTALDAALGNPGSTISKANTGYAVACWAKYKGYGGDTEYVRPILISASQGAAHLQKDGQGGSGVEYVYTKDNAGHTLYMAMSIDAFDPSTLSATGAWLADFTSATMPSVTPSDIADTLFPLILGASNFHWGEIDNPYSGGGTSEAGGGDGTFDFESTPVAFPGLPTIGGYDTGFTTMYNPTTEELKRLADYMWAGPFDIDNFRGLFASPMDAIIGLSIVPLTYSQISGTTSVLHIGNLSTGDTGITMKKVSAQYVQVNCGTVQVPAKWGAYLDYAPYTKLQLYLPYIGFVDIAPDDVMNGSISVQYTIDLMSGTALASVMCKDHVLYCFGANCSCSCPVTSGQYKNGALGVLDGIGIAASTASQMIPSISNLKAGGVAANMIAAGANATAALAEGAHKEFDNVQAMMKPAISRSGSIGGPMGLMNIQIPYLVLTVPRMCIPGDQETYMGYPSFVTKQMNDLTGYTEIMVTHLNNMSCTSVEAEEIISLLENGVIF